jgi:adenosine deaminase
VQIRQTHARPRESLLHFEGLADFLHFLDWACGLVRTREELSQAPYAFSQTLATRGAGFGDLIFKPTYWKPWHKRLPDMIDALDAGFRAAKQEGLPSVRLCVSLPRTQSADAAAELVDLLTQLRHPRVAALSIDGNEAATGRTGPRFAEAFRRAGAADLKRTVHAGVSSGQEGVRDAIELVGADSFDHGVRAIEDPKVTALLVERRIALGACPTSSLKLGVVPSMTQHPIERLHQAGMAVSVNTDYPAPLDTSLKRKHALNRETFDWSADDLCSVARTSIDASFANHELKTRLRAALNCC